MTQSDQPALTGDKPGQVDCGLSPGPLFAQRTSRRLIGFAFVFIAVIQCAYLIHLGNGVGKHCDDFSEANAIRAADAYLSEGFTAHHGLPRQAYGDRFPMVGFAAPDGERVWEHDSTPGNTGQRNQWVYKHYPEGPDVCLAIMANFIGLDNLRFMRLFPLGLGLIATATFFTALARTFGPDRAAVLAWACAVLPMFHLFMPALHFQGYSFALFLLQVSLLLGMFWKPASVSKLSFAALFLLGFLQGWLSFDQFFVIGLVALPFWLMRQAEGGSLPKRWLALCIVLPITGFGFAHGLHFLQVAGEAGGIGGAVAEFRNTAVERIGNTGQLGLPMMFRQPAFKAVMADSTHFAYLRALILAGYQYIRSFLHPAVPGFFPALPLAFVLVWPVLLFRSVSLPFLKPGGPESNAGLSFSWPERGSAIPSLAAALFVSVIWLFVMPAHSLANFPNTDRHFFVLYFFLVLTIVKSIRMTPASAALSPIQSKAAR